MSDARTALRVTVLMGGRSAEREVSLSTGEQVANALRQRGHHVRTLDAGDTSFIPALMADPPDAVFICLHGRFGEDGTVQGLLELLGLPYVGSGVMASAMALNKVVSKQVYAAAGIPSPDYLVLRRGEAPDRDAVTARLGPKTVVKPVNEGSSVGMAIVHEPAELPAAVEEAFRHDDVVMVERFEPGVEVTVGVIGNEDAMALPTLEIVPEHEYYDYESKYVPGMSAHIIPARISQRSREECARLAIAAHRALGCSGMSRSDTIVTPDDEILVLETNTIPGMTSTSLLPDAARAAGIEFPQLCERLIGLALERE